MSPTPVRTIEHVRAEELAACAELARLSLRLLAGLNRLAGFVVSVGSGAEALGVAAALLVRCTLQLGLEPVVQVKLEGQLSILDVWIDGVPASPEQWLQLEKAGLPVLARREGPR